MFTQTLQTALVAACLLSPALGGRFTDIRKAQEKRHADELFKRHAPQGHEKRQANSTEGFKFYSDATAPYLVESLPDVSFDLGELYGGLVPIDASNASRALFMMFQPKLGEPCDEVTIWLNGGPGCSSLEGFFQENGMVTWQPGTYAPALNPYSWVNETNVLWVEQPVGTGFSIGEVTATTQEETAQDFIKFFKNFEDLFGIKNYKIYVTGESYAGRYVPYISAAMLDEKDKEYYDLSGALVYDPCIGEFVGTQEEVPAVPYAKANNAVLNLNSTFVDQLDSLYESCGFADIYDTYLTFPPPGNQAPSYFNQSSGSPNASCDVFDMINNAVLQTNPCFDIYEINLACPLLGDVLSFPTELVVDSPTTVFDASTYFNRSDVKAAIHAPMDVEWAECKGPVFIGEGGPQGEGDLSADPIQHVLPQVIDATQRVLVSNGDYDMIIITNGTLLAIQNMTWGGQLGFQEAPSTPIDIMLEDLQYEAVFADNGLDGVDGPGQGVMGIQHYERGLMWAETFQSGHMQPQFQARSAINHLRWLLGRQETL